VAVSARARDKVVGANDINQVEELPADRAVKDIDASHESVGGVAQV